MPLPSHARIAGLALASALWWWPAAPAPGQEPSKPTNSPSEAAPNVPAAGHSVHGEAFNDGPRRRASLMPGMGRVDFPVTTASPEAQQFITQGVAQLHSFYYFEAERSFRQASQLDPACPMADWGMAMSNVSNPTRAKGFLKGARAKVAAAKPSRREELYIEALEALYKDGPGDAQGKKAHLLALETLVQEFPDDVEARAWMAMVTWQTGEIGSRQAVDMVLDSVLDRNPLHPGAHHYKIHLWDNPPPGRGGDNGKPSRAEKAAALYARSAPGIAHAWHMPGHTYTALKRHADAAYQQEGSARVDHAYMIRDRVMPFEIHNYAHNNQWLATSLGHVGRARDAVAVARNLVEQPRDPQKNGPNDGGSAQRSGRLRWAETLARFELWDDLIAATSSEALDWSASVPAEQAEKAYTLGLAYAAKGDQGKLAEEVAALKALDPKKPAAAGTAPPPSAGPGGDQRAASLAELEGHQALLKGDVAPAFEAFAKATRMRPEALARAHLAARNFGFAESTAKGAVEKLPGQVVPLATLVEVLHVCGKDKEAREAFARLEPLARDADRDTPIFRRLAPIVDAWKADGQWTRPTEGATDEALASTRVDLETLGPLGWSPRPSEPIALLDTEGKPWNLAEHKDRNVVALFYLGGKCAHCMQQLQEFGKQAEAFKTINTDLVAIGTDPLEAARALKSNADGIKFPMPFLPDPALEAFKRFQAFDDFERAPLHAVYLIDARGEVRFQRVSADPFLDVDFLKGEAARVNRLNR